MIRHLGPFSLSKLMPCCRTWPGTRPTRRDAPPPCPEPTGAQTTVLAASPSSARVRWRVRLLWDPGVGHPFSHTTRPEDLDVPDATFTRPDLTTFTRLDGLGLEVTGQLLEPDRSVLACRVVEPDDWCRRCGCQGVPRDTVSRELAHEPFGWRPTTLVLTVRRYRCKECSHVWRQDHRCGAAAGQDLPRRPAVGSGRDRRRPPVDGPSCRRTGRGVEHRQRRGPG